MFTVLLPRPAEATKATQIAATATATAALSN